MNLLNRNIRNSFIATSANAVFIMCALSMNIPAATAQVQPFGWEAIETALSKNGGMVAAEISSSFQVPGDDGPVSGSYKTRIRGWDKNGIPTRMLDGDGVNSSRAYKMEALDLSFATRIANHPEELFQRPDSMTLLGEETAEKKVVSIYEVRTRFTKGSRPVTAKIWMEHASGTLVKVEGVMEKMSLPGIQSANFSLSYRSDQAGHNLPAALKVNYTISIFFHTGQVEFSQQFSDWQPRPQQ
jgi:hypothetical protein